MKQNRQGIPLFLIKKFAMRSFLFFSFISFAIPLTAALAKISPSLEDTQVKKEEPKAILAAIEKPPLAQTRDVMIISPEMRSKDFQHALEYLKRKDVAAKIEVKLTNGTTLTNILKMDVMPGGTLLIFTLNTMKGLTYRLTKIEEIDTITHV